MAKFNIPKSPSRSIVQMSYFQGCDFTNSPANVDEYKSPNCVNMVRDVPGKVRKSMGWHTVANYPDRINGSFYLRSNDEQLIHSGDKIYHNNVLLYEGANDARSKSWQFDNKLYIVDGKELLVHWCEKAEEGGTYGSHDEEAHGDTHSASIKLKENDSVFFSAEYIIERVEVTWDGGSETIEPNDTEFEFTSTNAELTEYAFEIVFEPKSEIKTKSVDGRFTYDSDGYLSVRIVSSNGDYVIRKEVDKDGKEQYFSEEKDTSGEYLYTDDSGIAKKCTFSLGRIEFRKFDYDRFSASKTVTKTLSLGEVPGSFCNVYSHVDMRSISYVDSKGVKHTIPNTRDFDIKETGDIKLTYTISGADTVTYEYYEMREIDTSEQYDVYYKTGDRGILNYTVGRKPIDGFIDNLDGEYVENDGYKRVTKKVAEDAYVPTVTIAKKPSGGGQAHEPLNLIQPAFIEKFYGEANVKDFHLSFEGLDEHTLVVKLLNKDGEWIEKEEGKDFTVNRETGVVTFTTAPGVSPLDGEDNVSIQAWRTVEGYADRINKCTIQHCLV